MKYIVMECHEGYAVLMDEESRFVNAANIHYSVGQTVTEPILLNTETSSARRISLHISKFTAAAACLALAVCAGAFHYSHNYKAHSTVLISSEANVRMELNKKGKVLKLNADNPEGSDVLKNYDGKGKDMLTAANEILDIEKGKGYIDNGDTVDIYIKSENTSDYYSYKSDLITGIPDVKVKVQELDGNKPPHENNVPKPPEADPAKDTKKPEPPKPPHEDEKRPDPPKPADNEPQKPAAPAAPSASNGNPAPQVKQPDTPPAPPVSHDTPEPPRPDNGAAAPKPADKAEPPKPADPEKDKADAPHKPVNFDNAQKPEEAALKTLKLSDISPYKAFLPANEVRTSAADKNRGPAQDALPDAQKVHPPISNSLPKP